MSHDGCRPWPSRLNCHTLHHAIYRYESTSQVTSERCYSSSFTETCDNKNYHCQPEWQRRQEPFTSTPNPRVPTATADSRLVTNTLATGCGSSRSSCQAAQRLTNYYVLGMSAHNVNQQLAPVVTSYDSAMQSSTCTPCEQHMHTLVPTPFL